MAGCGVGLPLSDCQLPKSGACGSAGCPAPSYEHSCKVQGGVAGKKVSGVPLGYSLKLQGTKSHCLKLGAFDKWLIPYFLSCRPEESQHDPFSSWIPHCLLEHW